MAGSKWAKSQDGMLWLKSAVKTIESNWTKRSLLGPGSSWAWPILTESQIGPMSQYGLEHTHDLLWRCFKPSLLMDKNHSVGHNIYLRNKNIPDQSKW